VHAAYRIVLARGRRGFGLKGDRLKNLISEGDRKLDLKVSLAGYSGLDRLPDYQNIVASHPRYLRDFAKSIIEWDLPPVRFRSAGTTALYFNWARLALFSGVLGTNLTGAGSRAVYTDAGAQLDFRLVWATYMKSTFSVGFAEVRGNNGHISTEKMISLKLN